MKRILYLTSIIILFLLSSALRILSYKANLYNIAVDECHNLTNISRNFIYIFTNFIPGANALPLYRFLLHIIHNFFGFNFPVFKSISLICSILSFIVFYKVLSKLYTNKTAILSSLIIFTFNYSLILFSTKIKIYETEMLICLIILLGAIEIYNKYRDTHIPIPVFTIYSIVSVIIMYTALTGIAIIELYWLVFFIYWIKTKNIINIKKGLLFQAITAPFLILEFFTYIIQMLQDTSVKSQWLSDDFFFRPNSLNAVNSLIHTSFFNFFPYDSWYDINTFPKYTICLYILIFIIGSILFLVPIFKNEKNFSGLFVILPVYFFMMLSFLGIYPFCNRVIVFLIPIFIIILFKSCDFNNDRFKIISSAMAVIMTGIFLYNVYSFHNINSLFSNNDSMRIKEIHDRLENTKQNEIIISVEYICINCLNNNSVLCINENNEIKDKNQELDFYDGRNNGYLKSTLKDIINGYDTVIFAYNSGDDFTFTEPLKKMIISEGYKEIVNNYDKDYIDYAELKKIK